MLATRLDYQAPGRKAPVGLLLVILLHALIVWGLVSGLARKAVEIVKKPIEMKIMEEVKLPPPPPPPPPPPKPEKIKEAPPKVEAPPPPFVPPPEIKVATPPAPAIQATQSEPPREPVEIRPPPPPAPPAAPPAPVRAEVGIACPGYQKTLQAALAGSFERVGIEGTVKVLIRVKNNQIVDVTPQGGPREYHRIVQAAVKRMNCVTTGAEELLVPLDVRFAEE